MKTHNRIIYSSSDYNKFVRDPTNRDPINNTNLAASMERHGWLPAYPAFVVPCAGSKFKIKDGQNRFEIAQTLGLPVLYVVGEEDSISIPEVNNSQRKWTLANYVSSFVSQGVRSYARLASLAEEFRLPLATTASLLHGVTNCTTPLACIKTGKFMVNDEPTARRVVRVIDTARAVGIQFATSARFVTAIAQAVLLGGASPETLASRIKSNPKKIVPCATVDQFLEVIECVYNYRSPEFVPIAGTVKQSMKKLRQQSGARLGKSKTASL